MIGGGFGSLVRFIVATSIASRYGVRFPLGTFVVNVSGSFLIGVLMTLLTERVLAHPNWRYLLVIGFLGGYTTFSSFEYETYAAARTGSVWMGLAYVIASVVVGYLAVWMGASLLQRR